MSPDCYHHYRSPKSVRADYRSFYCDTAITLVDSSDVGGQLVAGIVLGCCGSTSFGLPRAPTAPGLGPSAEGELGTEEAGIGETGEAGRPRPQGRLLQNRRNTQGDKEIRACKHVMSRSGTPKSGISARPLQCGSDALTCDDPADRKAWQRAEWGRLRQSLHSNHRLGIRRPV